MTAVGTLGIPTLVIGGVYFADTTNLIKLGTQSGGATNRYASFRKMGAQAGAGYTPSGTKYYMNHAVVCNPLSTTAGQFSVAAADNDSGGAGTTAPTNPIYFGGESNSLALNLQQISYAQLSTYSFPFHGKVGNGKYMTLVGDGTASSNLSVLAFGYEV